jgi:hypothetical protein
MAQKKWSSLSGPLIAVFMLLGSCDGHATEQLTGLARVSDGDTISIGKRTLRLVGIDSPETDQLCLDANGNSWTCGISARDALSAHIAEHVLTCEGSGKDGSGRTLARCSAEDQDLSGWMVRQGWALAFVRYSRRYVDEETSARHQVPITAQTILLSRIGRGRSYTGMHYQGKRESQGRAYLLCARATRLFKTQNGPRRKTLVLFRGGCPHRRMASS